MDLKTFTSAISEIALDRGIPKEKVLEIIEDAIAAAYKKDYGKKKQKIKAKIDAKTGKVKFQQLKLVVTKDMILSDEELERLKKNKGKALFKEKSNSPETNNLKKEEKIRFNPERHIFLEEAKKIDSDIKAGEDLRIPLKTEENYGRIAAQTAKQVILQKIKEAEREETFKEYKKKEGEIVSGIVQKVEPGAVTLNIGKITGILVKGEEIPHEFYRPGQRLKAYVLKVEQTQKGPLIFLSRAYPKFISKLFELEVPEIESGEVVIKSIAREAGSRSKVAVEAVKERVDPIGAMVGQRGTRILAVTNELGGEKIDIVEYSDDPKKYIANALSPAKVSSARIMPKNEAQAIISPDQLSLAIGKEGQNVRLAAKLTGWKIDVRSTEEIAKEEEEEKKKKEKEEKSAKKEKAEKEN
ncbi:transcription termination/antitermination protein NusA [bacterium]|nr:transcription termination/antitermination protein NusA [bacterium]